jgi:hypothetical protein
MRLIIILTYPPYPPYSPCPLYAQVVLEESSTMHSLCTHYALTILTIPR